MIHGILVIDKPLGMTSHDVVSRVRKLLCTRKVGHAGTLDPDASGVLVVCVGDATRLLEYLSADRKAYEARVAFGSSTDTDDASGRILEQRSASALAETMVQAALPTFTGELVQQVPIYSAVHIDGERAYDLARRGETFEPPSRTIQIYQLSLQRFEPGETAYLNLSVACSKGTYIRSLARDLGRYLDVPAHLAGLRRTVSGQFRIEEAITLTELEALTDKASVLLPLAVGVRGLPQIVVEEPALNRLKVGQMIPLPSEQDNLGTGQTVAVMNRHRDAQLVAVTTVVESNGRWLKPRKVFWKKDC